MNTIHVLLVEDDTNLGFLLRENLSAKGIKVTLAETGEEGLVSVKQQPFDLCIFDIMLPKLDGFSLAEAFRKLYPQVPFLFLTARAMEKDKIRGFEIGADDYIAKPFSFKELYYRINAILRRTHSIQEEHTTDVLELSQCKFYPDMRVLRINDEEKKMSQREAGLLEVLLRNKGNYITRSEMLKTVWGNDDYFTGKSMDVYITRLRKILKPDTKVEIENLYGTGYRIKENTVI